MDRIFKLCRYVVVLLVSFEYVCCTDGTWTKLDRAEKSWGVTLQCQSSKTHPRTVAIKLKNLSCADLGMDYGNAYIIYAGENKDNSSFELLAVRSDGEKIAESIVMLPFANIELNDTNKNNNKLVIRDTSSNNSYELTFNKNEEALDVVHKYAPPPIKYAD